MRTVVVSDIFGKTKALEKLCRNIATEYEIIDPYSGEDMGFKNEAQAYEHFAGNIGLDHYSNHLLKHLEGNQIQINLLGFSIGASAIWKISSSLKREIAKHVAGFYGSQIRKYLEVEPAVVIELYLPAFEPTFSISALADRLTSKMNVRVHQTGYLHGFMNELSVNFSREGYIGQVNRLREWAS